MNREIKFKAKRKDNKEWVYGDLIDGKFFFDKSSDYYDAPYYDDELGVIDGRLIEVIPETICQYTGITDKNGVKIYEGDIIKNHCGYKAVIKYGEYEYGSIKHCGFYIQDIEFYDVFNLWGSGCEVIGNISDNRG